ncbi:pyridoxamine 5'-phosphate oxidase family protein [Falsiroseomonas selenitidurans]|uniref:Pyridoxamine 5-phosphate oxidase n=1 Tax=Falsiroseomonas selenitidurans TaxID=2716335 RepID=A0ABX1E1T9_9PROT|nr:pyridoxamine 5'-phosphate oxidase family protein [Falsiroseomonas selenitidurans]NKC31126.1 pyridoxamine 5-phosphate oxidase [Falsiroseomonas selenitidurans]
MGHRFIEITATPSVKAARAAQGSAAAYARFEGGPDTHDRLGPAEAGFIVARDSAYIASVSETGWPYIQHRGGAPGFLVPLDDRRIAFADLRGNRQYLTLGNIAAESRVALFLMDYPNRRRLKLLGRMAVGGAEDATLAPLRAASSRAERLLVVTVEAFDWNCPQHITPRFTEAEVMAGVAPLRRRLEELEAENRALRQGLNPDQ